jgi:hypothetical protein
MSNERRTIPLVRELSAAARDCPLAPPETASVHSRTLHRACVILGGIAQLARHLGVDESELKRWMRGEPQVPEPVFLAAVEVLLLYASNGQSN